MLSGRLFAELSGMIGNRGPLPAIRQRAHAANQLSHTGHSNEAQHLTQPDHREAQDYSTPHSLKTMSARSFTDTLGSTLLK